MSSNATGVWQKTLVYLGLWEEPEAEPYDGLRPRDNGPATAIEPDPTPTSTNVRPLRLAGDRAQARTVVVEVRDFETDCQRIVRHHRDGEPLVFDLAAVDAATARRVLDVVAGMTYALHGQLSKVASRAFLLLPEDARLSNEDQARLEAHGYRFADGA